MHPVRIPACIRAGNSLARYLVGDDTALTRVGYDEFFSSLA